MDMQYSQAEIKHFMKEAIRRAKTAAKYGETPVGCVIVKDGKIVASGRNKRENGRNALYHAEIEAINKACKKLGGWRLHQCDLFVTLEPCPMCAGAIINAKIDKVIYGAMDMDFGSCGSKYNLFSDSKAKKIKVYGGIKEEECIKILKDYFSGLR